MKDNRAPHNFRIGTDLVEIERFRGFDRNSSFVQRIFTELEIDYCYSFQDPSSHLASSFAGKEAVVKALKTKSPIGYQSIEILRDEDGGPYVRLPDELSFSISISLTHTSEYAAAVALVLNDDELDYMSAQKLLNDTSKKILPDE